jgi:hypothetical protein
MAILIGIIIIIGSILIWFHIPYSPVKSRFAKDVEGLKDSNKLKEEGDAFSSEDFSHLPLAIRRYIEYCGYIGTPKMSYLKMKYHDVDFMQGRTGPALKIDYTQYDFVSAPCRMALIDSSMFGTPFEGYDYYRDGIGGMKGVIAKGITLFHQTGAEMDKACLVTYLAEVMFAPSALLQDYIAFEEISDYEVKATIQYGGQIASGIFTFNEKYEYVLFTTNDRGVTNADGTMEYIPWSAVCGDYPVSGSGIKYPTKFQAVWNYPDGDFLYFDGRISEISYE